MYITVIIYVYLSFVPYQYLVQCFPLFVLNYFVFYFYKLVMNKILIPHAYKPLQDCCSYIDSDWFN